MPLSQFRPHFFSWFYLGIVSLVAKDASDSFVLVAMAYVTIENKENWMWIITQANDQLLGAFGRHDMIVLIDWEKGLNCMVELDFFAAVLSCCTEHAFKNLLLSFARVKKQHKPQFMAIVMAGNAEF